MLPPSRPAHVPHPPTYPRSERVLLTGVSPEHRAQLLHLLRSPDRSVRDMAVVLVFLDREAAERTR